MAEASLRKLFLDDYDVEKIERLRRTVHQPKPHSQNPVLKPKMPWEAELVSHYGTMLYDEDDELFRFYYLCQAREMAEEGKTILIDGQHYPVNVCLLAYATSKDGIHWDRPVLGQVNYEGSTENNLIRMGRGDIEGVAILDEPDDPDPSRRYKAFYWNQGGGVETEAGGMVIGNTDKTSGVWVSFSPDGIHWDDYEGNPVLGGSDTGHYVVKNPLTKKYIGYGRFIPGKGLKVNGQYVRILGSAQSDDFINWSDFAIAMEADDKEITGPPPDTQVYGMTVEPYEGLFIGGVWLYHFAQGATLDTQLAVSRDGVNWSRVADRQVFLPLGPKGSRDDGAVRPVAHFITRGDELYIYYGMINGAHQTPGHREIKRKYPGSVGLGVLRRDGFVSLDADDDEGYILTKPFWLEDVKYLHLNVDVAPTGYASVSVCDWWEGLHPSNDTSDGALDGFERSDLITGNHKDVVTHWPDQDLSTLAYQRVRLKIRLKEAKLYSYWFK